MKKIFLLSVFVLFFFKSNSQIKDTIYVDESYNKITRNEFKRKALSSLFYSANLNKDSIHYKKLRYKEYFGSLGFKKKHQLNKLFNLRFKIDTTKIWLIHYVDSLPDMKRMPVKSGIILLDSIGRQDGKILSKKDFSNLLINRSTNRITINSDVSKRKHRHVTSYKDYKRIISKERKRYKKFKNVELIHFYEFNKGYPKEDIENNKWYQDKNKLLKRTFTDGMKMYKVIVLFPNGDFCLNPYGPDKAKKILKRKKYLREKKKWKKNHDYL